MTSHLVIIIDLTWYFEQTSKKTSAMKWIIWFLVVLFLWRYILVIRSMGS